ncbi:unnamed protein product [Rhizophagus irregularis]|nr:unnamed protein product [Rhizophagus irregularis]
MEELLSTFQTYREHWLFLHPELHETIQEITQEYLRTQQLKLDAQFSQTLDTLLNNLQDIIPPSTSELINIQLTSLRINPPILPQCSTLNLPNDQLHVLSTIKNILAPTGVASQNIGGQTIHSALRIREMQNGFQTLAFHDYEFFKNLQQIDTLIIDEISMVSAALLSFISEMFSVIQQTTIAFGGLNVIIVGDLAQLPPVTGLPVYKSSEWKLFYPLFLKEPQR